MKRQPNLTVTVSGAAFLIAVAVISCSLFDAHVGALQECGANGANPTASGAGVVSGAAYYGSNPNSVPLEAVCAADAGSACDDCENGHCCATRTACYGDPVCACADKTLDQCLGAVGADEGGQGSQRPRCWDAFSAKGTVESARVACERAWCRAECSVPDVSAGL